MVMGSELVVAVNMVDQSIITIWSESSIETSEIWSEVILIFVVGEPGVQG